MKWENKIIHIQEYPVYWRSNHSNLTYNNLEDILNELGKDRWEFVTVNSCNQYFFKRQIIQ